MTLASAVAFLQQYRDILTLAFTAIVALATVVYAALTLALVNETRRLRQIESEPRIAVYLSTEEQYIGFIDLVIHNYSRSAARSIIWELDPSAEKIEGWGVFIGPLKNATGLSLLAPGQVIRTFFGSAEDVFQKKPAESTIRVVARFRDELDRAYEQTFLLDIGQFEGIVSLGEPAAITIANATKSMAASLQRWTEHNQLKVLHESLSEYKARLEQWRRSRAVQGEPPVPGGGPTGTDVDLPPRSGTDTEGEVS